MILLGNIKELHQYFGTFGLALWSHFVIVTMETWPDVADAVLEVASPLWGVYFVVPWKWIGNCSHKNKTVCSMKSEKKTHEGFT